MKRTILIFGLISGAISSLMMVSTIPFLHKIGTAKGRLLAIRPSCSRSCSCFSESGPIERMSGMVRSRSEGHFWWELVSH